MKTIWKFPLQTTDRQVILIPGGYKILAVQTQQDNILCLWALVEDSNPVDSCYIRIIGTGQNSVDVERLDYIGTCQLHRGELVFHVFTLKPEAK